VVVRIQPFIPIFCEKGLEDLIKKVSELGAKAVTIEYLKLAAMQTPIVKKAIAELSTILGYDLDAFYKKFGKKTATDFELKAVFKKSWILKTKELVHKYGLEFYCADNEFRGLGDSSVCCGTGDEEGFQHMSQSRTSRIFDIDKSTFTLDDIINDEELLGGINKHWLNAGNAYKGARSKNMSLLDELKMAWNNPRSPLSPCKFYVNIKYLGKDKEGNAIYSKVKG